MRLLPLVVPSLVVRWWWWWLPATVAEMLLLPVPLLRAVGCCPSLKAGCPPWAVVFPFGVDLLWRKLPKNRKRRVAREQWDTSSVCVHFLKSGMTFALHAGGSGCCVISRAGVWREDEYKVIKNWPIFCLQLLGNQTIEVAPRLFDSYVWSWLSLFLCHEQPSWVFGQR